MAVTTKMAEAAKTETMETMEIMAVQMQMLSMLGKFFYRPKVPCRETFVLMFSP